MKRSPAYIRLIVFCLRIAVLLTAAGSLLQCAAPKQTGTYHKIKHFFEKVDLFENAFTGFVLYDPIGGKEIYSRNRAKYFTPASNTKIFTLYTALQVLEDSLPALTYLARLDSLYVWGMGDPTIKHHSFAARDRALDWLQNRTEQIVLCTTPNETKRFGPGWAWDDYQYGYQAERTSLPLYSNKVQIQYDSLSRQIILSPASLRASVKWDDRGYRIERGLSDNAFQIQLQEGLPSFTSFSPFYTDKWITSRLLSTSIGRTVVVQEHCPEISQGTILYGEQVDTVYKYFMQNSDNFIAEQLLQVCSGLLFDTMDIDRMIRFAKDNFLSDLSDELLWYDGSGLSRYNMFTPRSIVELLTKLWQEHSQDRLFSIFPAGGKSGTIANWYGSDEPFVFAKTGTLRNNHCLSGYLITDRGKTLIFSFMHNHYPGSSVTIKQGMAKVLDFVKRNY